MSKPFHFKQFTIHQDQCAMKVGTDGVLLGAWASLEHQPNTILDIGSGTGLLALQMAQRSSAEIIDAIELDASAYEQCVFNFEESHWSDRLFCYHADFRDFVHEMDDQYDLIISNPPFYKEEVKSGNDSRDRARQTGSLPFETLLEGVSKLLAPNGLFTTIIPFKEEIQFLDLGKKVGLYANRITHVKGNPSSEIKRSLLEFSFKEMKPDQSKLVIEHDRHQYTEEYKKLTQDFYLKM